ncbi:MAG: cyclic nucleotide-binding protein [Kangiellaceae bacterium]|nr:cyclic nucleotide-binding protein [Kangiellaceae bacterium]
MSEQLLKMLDQIPVFGGLSPDSLSLILDNAQTHQCQRGECFFREGDSAASMFVLGYGDVVVLKRWQDNDYVLGHLQPGDCFGEMSLIDFQPRSATIRAEVPSQAYEISVDSIHKIWSSDPEQYAMLQMNMAREVSRRLRVSDDSLFEKRVMAEEFPRDDS